MRKTFPLIIIPEKETVYVEVMSSRKKGREEAIGRTRDAGHIPQHEPWTSKMGMPKTRRSGPSPTVGAASIPDLQQRWPHHWRENGGLTIATARSTGCSLRSCLSSIPLQDQVKRWKSLQPRQMGLTG